MQISIVFHGITGISNENEIEGTNHAFLSKMSQFNAFFLITPLLLYNLGLLRDYLIMVGPKMPPIKMKTPNISSISRKFFI